MFHSYRQGLKSERLKVTARTIHAAKGLEAKVVFIIGLKAGSGGFPDVWLDDVIYRIVKEVKYDMLMEEERRLFYVALTRAKDELHLITELGNESQFIDEIPQAFFSVGKHALKNMVDELPTLCVKCQTEIEPNYRFCPTCGNSIDR
jgi:DNA helicase-4